jgi:hypothetical protein
MPQQPVIVVGAIAIEGGPPQKCVISGMARSQPLQIWGGGGVGDYIDAGFPGPQPGQPPRPWGPINYPDQGLPGNQPGLWPGKPPYMDIGFPGPQPGGPVHIWGGPWYPPVIWPGPGPLPYPDQGLPGAPPPTGGEGGGAGKWTWVYSPVYGWVLDPGLGGKPQPTPTPPEGETPPSP